MRVDDRARQLFDTNADGVPPGKVRDMLRRMSGWRTPAAVPQPGLERNDRGSIEASFGAMGSTAELSRRQAAAGAVALAFAQGGSKARESVVTQLAAAVDSGSDDSAIALIDALADIEGGLALLAAIRVELHGIDDEPRKKLDTLLRNQLKPTMSASLLDLRAIAWDSPAQYLEHIAAFDTVHPIESFDALRLRLQPDRQCRALFHPGFGDEPLAIVWVALTNGTPTSMRQIIDPARTPAPPTKADTAAFYSVTACQPGLAGLGLGTRLILATINATRAALPNVERTLTLSPMPGLMSWLRSYAAAGSASGTASASVAASADGSSTDVLRRTFGFERSDAETLALLTDPVWMAHPESQSAAEPLVRAATTYLCSRSEAGTAIDSVARFHLGNGARIVGVHPFADRSERALTNSAGVMVNYRYDLDQLAANQLAYRTGGTIAIDRALRDYVTV